MGCCSWFCAILIRNNLGGKAMKKIMYVALVAVFMVVGLVPMASAATGNDQQNSSYLVFSKIINNIDPAYGGVQDTVVTMYNDSPRDVSLHCFWMNEFQEVRDIEFEITMFQTVWWMASTGKGMLGPDRVNVSPFNGRYGELKCWVVKGWDDDELATNAGYDKPTKKNVMTGSATIYDFTYGTAIQYNAFGFKKVSANTAANAELILDGKEYDACPAYVFGTYQIPGTSFTDRGYVVTAGTAELTLVPCKQDLRINGRQPVYGKALLTVLDEDEVGYSGAYLCFKCWIETTLDDPPVTSGVKSNWYKPVAYGFDNFVIPNGVFATVKAEPEYGYSEDCNFPSDQCAQPFIGLLFQYQQLGTLWATSGGMMHQTAAAFNYDVANGGCGVPPTVIYTKSKNPQNINPR